MKITLTAYFTNLTELFVLSLSSRTSPRVSITFEVDAWVNQCKWQAVTLVFYKGLSENQGRVTGRERQISDSIDGGVLPVTSL